MTEIKSDNGTQVFGGKVHFLILKNGRLFGLGDNTDCQISQIREKEIQRPCYIADNVISAAAGNNETAYVTADGEVTLFGNGKYAKNFKGFSGAVQILYDYDYDIYYIRDSENRFFGFGSNEGKKLIDDESIKDVFEPVRIPQKKENELKNCSMWCWKGCMPFDLPGPPANQKKNVSCSNGSYSWKNVQIYINRNDDIVFDGGVGRSLVKFPKVNDIAITAHGEYLFAVKDSNELLCGKITDVYSRNEDAALINLFRKGASVLSRKNNDEFYKIRHITLP